MRQLPLVGQIEVDDVTDDFHSAGVHALQLWHLRTNGPDVRDGLAALGDNQLVAARAAGIPVVYRKQALAELGWLEYEAGAEGRQSTLLSLGEGEEQQAERVDPADFAPHLYLGSMLLAQGDATGAVDQYRQFLADHPPRAKVSTAAPFIVKAFSAAHLTPPALAEGPSSG